MVPLANMDSSFERILGGKKRKREKETETYSFEINLVPYSENVFAEYSWKDLVEKCKDKDIRAGKGIKNTDIKLYKNRAG